MEVNGFPIAHHPREGNLRNDPSSEHQHRGVPLHPPEPPMTPQRVIGEGDLVPAVVLVDHEGSQWSLEEHRGRPLVLILHRHLA